MYVADFETTRTIPTRVWLWSICSIEKPDNKCEYGTTLQSFFNLINSNNYPTVYFHNLKFDGHFIMWYILKELKYKYSEKNEPETFSTLINDMGVWYSIRIRFKKFQVTIYDSLKKLPMSVRRLAKAFKLDISKGDIDHTIDRPIGYEPTKHELDYVFRDVRIVAKCLNVQFEQGLTKMTIGSDALSSYKKIIESFRLHFPELTYEVDKLIRKSYKGGYVYANPMYQGLDVGKGCVYDVNSMYPWAMRYMPMPHGKPIYFTGKYIDDELYPLFIVKFVADFSLKENCLPTVTLKNKTYGGDNEYIINSNGAIELTMTSVDLALFYDNYNIYGIDYIGGFKFMQSTSLFDEYIDYWIEIKKTSTGAIRELAKLMLNSLYGKFAKNPNVKSKVPHIVEDRIKLLMEKEEIVETNYLPVGAFITAWARHNLIRTIMSVKDRFLYCDTDSIHLLGHEEPDINIHDNNLGAWKLENKFERGRYLHSKCYIEEMSKEYWRKDEEENDIKLVVTCAGMPDGCKKQVTFDNFKLGQEYTGKLKQKSVTGGVILEETTHILRG